MEETMKTRFICLMLVLLMTLTLIPIGAPAAAATAGGQYCGKEGDNLIWSLENGTLTIGGTGEMADYDEEKNPAPWGCDGFTNVVIQESVTSIGTNAFYFCSFENISLPGSLKSIGAGAFAGCFSLSEITIPAAVTTIGENAFSGCINIKSVTIPDSVKSVGAGAFSSCEGLTKADLPQGITVVPDQLFADCKMLENAVIPDGVKTIGKSAFFGCSAVKKVNIPDSVEVIGEEAFCGCRITELTIPGSVSSIGENAFGGNGISSVRFDGTSARWTEIGGRTCGLDSAQIEYLRHDHDFGGAWLYDALNHWHKCSLCDEISEKEPHSDLDGKTCSVCGAQLPEIIDKGAFGANLSWELKRDGTLTVGGEGKMPSFTAQEDETPWSAYKSRILRVVTESGVTAIGSNAFSGCASLSKVSVSDTVESIDLTAFDNCTALSEYSVSDGSKSFSSDLGVLFNADKTRLVSCPAGKTGSYTVPETVQTIGDKAFFCCRGLESVEIPDSVTVICEGAFENCAKLARLNLPKGLTSIDKSVFSGCAALAEVVIPDSVGKICDGAFSDCASLASITLPDSVKTLGRGAFSGCASLEEIKIPEGVAEIPDDAFSGCSALKTVTIPKSVAAIGSGAFEGCAALEKVNYLGSDSDWENVTLKGNNVELKNAQKDYTRIDHTHSYTVTVTEPTCTVRGSTVHTCACGESFEDGFKPPLGHSYKNGRCIRCGAVEAGSSGDGAGHSHDFKPVVTEPTCTSEGFTTYTCSCGENYTKDYTAALGHETETVNAKDATCSEDGYTGDLLCSRCGTVTESGKVIEATGHEFSGGVCLVCGEKQSAPTPVFADVKQGSFYYDAVQWAVKNGVTKGTGATTFSPKDTCTRFQIVMFLWRASGCPKAEAGTNFTDVKPEDSFFEAVQWAVGRGITKGTGGGAFSPYAPCTRAQIVTFLYRAASSPNVGGACTFSDVSAGAYYQNAVVWAIGQGITKGTGDNKFSPDLSCTRAEAVTLLYRAMNK